MVSTRLQRSKHGKSSPEPEVIVDIGTARHEDLPRPSRAQFDTEEEYQGELKLWYEAFLDLVVCASVVEAEQQGEEGSRYFALSWGNTLPGKEEEEDCLLFWPDGELVLRHFGMWIKLCEF